MEKKGNKLKQEMLSLIAERDESIRQAFGALQSQIGQSFGIVDFKIALVFKVLAQLGYTQEKIQVIAASLEQELKANAAKNEGVENGSTIYRDSKTSEESRRNTDPGEGGETQSEFGEESFRG